MPFDTHASMYQVPGEDLDMVQELFAMLDVNQEDFNQVLLSH